MLRLFLFLICIGISNTPCFASNITIKDIEIGISSDDEHPNVLKISAADLTICDDRIAKAIGYPEPVSVSEAIEAILKIRAPANKKLAIDLSSNIISDEGAALIGKNFSNMQNLESLNLSWNRITDDGIVNLILCLKPILLQDGFQELDITGNHGANIANVCKILSSLANEEHKVIIGKKIQTEKVGKINIEEDI